MQNNLLVAARYGHIIELATLGGTNMSDVNMLPIIVKNLKIEGSTLRSKDLEYQRRLRDLLASKLDKFSSGEFKILIDKVFDMETIQEAHQMLQESSRTGKLICKTGL